jgi:hypothetical protein
MAGRKGARKRWAGKTQQQKSEHAAQMREAMASNAVSRAREQAARLGLTLNQEQAAKAGAALLKIEQRERADHARIAAQAANQQRSREAFNEWAARQALTYHNLLRTWAPAVDGAAQMRVVLMAVSDEQQAPDGPSRPRLIRRLMSLVEHAKAQAATRSRELAVPWDAPDDDMLQESAEFPQQGLTRRGLVSDLSPEEQAQLLDLDS